MNVDDLLGEIMNELEQQNGSSDHDVSVVFDKDSKSPHTNQLDQEQIAIATENDIAEQAKLLTSNQEHIDVVDIDLDNLDIEWTFSVPTTTNKTK